MRVVVTGGAGFLGSRVVEALLAAGHGLLVLDDLSSGHRDRIPAAVAIVEADVRDVRLVSAAFSGFRPHVVVHLAARPLDPRSGCAATEHVDVNIIGALSAADAAAAAGVEHFVFASSAAVYGELNARVAGEDHPRSPRSANGITKLAAEGLLLERSAVSLPIVTALRFANLYGPGTSAESASAVQSFVDSIENGGSPVINGDGNQTRDFVFVQDAADAVLAAVESRPAGIFNVGTGIETSVRELAERVAAMFSVTSVEPIFQPSRPNDVRRSCLDSSKLYHATGFRATTDIEKGLEATIAASRATILQN